MKRFKDFLNENNITEFKSYWEDINNQDNWIAISDNLYDLIEEDGWVQELTDDISDDIYEETRNEIKNRFTYFILNIPEEDSKGLMDAEEEILEKYNDFDIELKSDQEYPFTTIDYIDYDDGIVYIFRYNQ